MIKVLLIGILVYFTLHQIKDYNDAIKAYEDFLNRNLIDPASNACTAALISLAKGIALSLLILIIWFYE